MTTHEAPAGALGTVTLVQAYDPDWPAQFERVEAYVAGGLAGLDAMIEHVGSTAIPGMVAKPIIDLDIVIAPGTFERCWARLEALGYRHEGDLGCPGREAFDLVEAGRRASLPPHHLYVCEQGALELRKHLAFRDFLRTHVTWREQLGELKWQLCVDHANDREAYMAGKAEMVATITGLAMHMDGLDEATRHALEHDKLIDIVTTGARSGLPRRTEIWFTNVNGRIIICGTPDAAGVGGARARRDWLANLKAHPEFLFCLKESVRVQLRARAVPVTDPADRRALMSASATQWYRDQVASVEDLVAGSPIVEVFFTT